LLKLKTTPALLEPVYLKEILFVVNVFGLLIAAVISKELKEPFNR